MRVQFDLVFEVSSLNIFRLTDQIQEEKNMKKLTLMTATAGVILALSACASTSTPEATTAAAQETTVAAEETTAAAEETTAAAEEEGTTLTGTGKGFGGDVTVTLTMDGDKIVAASIEGKDETPNVGGAALADLEKQIVDAGSDEIDGVSGATITSTGVKEAVKAALAK